MPVNNINLKRKVKLTNASRQSMKEKKIEVGKTAIIRGTPTMAHVHFVFFPYTSHVQRKGKKFLHVRAFTT